MSEEGGKSVELGGLNQLVLLPYFLVCGRWG